MIDYHEGLSTAIHNSLLRAGFGTVPGGRILGPPLDRERLAKAVRDGSIRDVRLIGPVSIRRIREWLKSENVAINEDLIPCQFCGSKRVGIEKDGSADKAHYLYIFCRDCQARGPRYYIPGFALTEAGIVAETERGTDVLTTMWNSVIVGDDTLRKWHESQNDT